MVGTRAVPLVDIEIVPVLDPNPRVLDADYIQENRPNRQTFPPENLEIDKETY